MNVLSPSWAMSANAVHSLGDPHLPDGLHYRIYTDRRMGLPMRPIWVNVQPAGHHGTTAQPRIPGGPSPLRHDAIWVDSNGIRMIPPFRVSLSNPVTAWLPINMWSRCVCVYADLEQVVGTVRVDAFHNTRRGPSMLGGRESAPYGIGGSDIHGVVVTGSCIVNGIAWLDFRRMHLSDEGINTMSLPRESGARYLGMEPGDDEREARQRVRRGAPLRVGMHDEPNAAGPSSASVAVKADELAKLDTLRTDLDPAIDALLNDLSAPQHALELVESLTDGLPPDQPAEARARALDRLLLAQSDPTWARWLGFMDTNADFGFPAEDVVVYYFDSWWAVDPSVFGVGEGISALQSLPGLLTTNTPLDVRAPLWNSSPDGFPIYALRIPVGVVSNAPTLPPVAPGFGPEIVPTMPASLDGLGPWLPAVPPVARRRAQVTVTGLVPACGVAFAVQENNTFRTLNEARAITGGAFPERALLLVPSRSADADNAHQGSVAYNNVPPEGALFRLSQADTFGRWSEWAEFSAASKTRPRPPAPVFDVDYVQGDPASVGPNRPLFGTLTVRVQVPTAADMAAGSNLLRRVRLTGTVFGTPFQVGTVLTDPLATELAIQIPPTGRAHPGVMLPGEVGEAVISGVWIDTAGVESDASRERHVTLADPRAPHSLPAPPRLDWTARPDATGQATVVLAWTPSASQPRFRVYFADETRLVSQVSALAGSGNAEAQAFLAARDTATDAPSRAEAFRDHVALFDREWFENLTGDPLLANGGQMRYSHRLSGTLSVLAFYKVVPESAGGIAADFASTDLWAWGVPVQSGPLQPMLEIGDPPEHPLAGINLRVRLMGGSASVTRYRLRRSRIQSGEAARMPIAREGRIPAGTDREFTILDNGAYLHDPSLRLAPFTPYSWRVEVQAADMPGSNVAGTWSKASDAASTYYLPRPPHAPSAPVLAVAGSTVTLTWTYTGLLIGGAMGKYRFEIYRTLPNAQSELLATVTAGGAMEYDDTTAVSALPAGTDLTAVVLWMVAVVDPIGRRGAASESTGLTAESLGVVS